MQVENNNSQENNKGQENNQDDGVKLIPAEQNPWYLLATEKRYWWNKYQAGFLSDSQLAEIRELRNEDGSPRFREEELIKLNAEELVALKKLYERAGGKGELPKGIINFRNNEFSKQLFVEGFLFARETYFDNSVFHKDANFTNATFLSIIDFFKVNFSEKAHFKNAYFYDQARFYSNKFRGDANFQGATFEDFLSFRFSSFNEGIYFYDSDKKFTKFKKHPPNFNGVEKTIPEGTIWPIEENWPKKPPNDIFMLRFDEFAYQRLKKDAETHKKHEWELFFFSKELECKKAILKLEYEKKSREIKTKPEGERECAINRAWLNYRLELLPYYLYEKLSGYGHSIGKPIKLLVWSILLCFICFWAHSKLLFQSLGVSFANSFALFGLRKELGVEKIISCYPTWLVCISGFQTIWGALMLFLLGLALRNKFKMK